MAEIENGIGRKEEEVRKTRGWVFYSSRTEPELLTFYADGLAYLKDQGVELKIVDVAEDKEKAKEFDVRSTPTVILGRNGEELERYEVVSYLDGILEKDELKKALED